MQGDGGSESLDAERARLIGSIYEVVLRPEHFDSFMADWSDFVDQAARRLGELRVTDGPSARQLEDPVIEAHFRRAFALFERMGRGETVVPLAQEAHPPLVRLGRGGIVLEHQPEAELLFGAHPTLESIREALDPDSATRLGAYLGAFERAPSSGRFAVLSLAEPPEALSEDLPGGGLVALVTTRDPEGEGFRAELRAMSIAWTPSLAGILAESFHLTPRETELVHDLMRGGGGLPAVARRSGRSLNTLRAQLKSVFAKTRTNGQSELMRLVAALLMHGPEAEPHPEPAIAGGAEIEVEVGEGRKLPVILLGPEAGLPLVFVHGMLEGLASLAGLEPLLHAQGLRLIAPMRPNFGSSYSDPRIREAPEVFARDLGQILGALELSRVVLVGHMAGALYAHAAAALQRRAVAGLAAVAGCVPITSIEQFSSMTPRQRAVAYTARFAPALLPAVLRAGIAQIDSRSAQDFMIPLYPPGSRDRAIVDRQGVAETLVGGYRYTVAQGPRAFQIDAWHITRNWSALALGVECPLRLIHGALDPVVSPGSVRDFARARAEAGAEVTLHEIAGEGQLLLYSQPGPVLADLAAFARRCLARG